jgi:hypothetical protein
MGAVYPSCSVLRVSLYTYVVLFQADTAPSTRVGASQPTGKEAKCTLQFETAICMSYVAVMYVVLTKNGM